MARSVHLVLVAIFLIEKSTTFKLEKYIDSDSLLSKSFGFPLEIKSVKMLTDSLITKEYLDLYKEMLKISADDEPYSHVKSRNVPMTKENTKGREYRRRRNGHTLELIAHRRNKHQAARRERLVRQSQSHKRRNAKHAPDSAHKHKMHHVPKKHGSTTKLV